jgi:hypothetical protein
MEVDDESVIQVERGKTMELDAETGCTEIKDKERDMIRDKERDLVRDRERDLVRDRERDVVRDRERDLVRDGERGVLMEEENGERPQLTVEKVLAVFKRISSIKTPLINSQLALPFKMKPVKNSIMFKEEYAEIKSDIRKIDGRKGKMAYEQEKEKRKSLPFNWPASSPETTGTIFMTF